jgi:hypothetical protein
MSKFLTSLITENVDDVDADGRGLWRVYQPLTYQSDLLQKTITVEPGFITDYASVPRVPLLYDLLGDTAHKSAVLHDWLYHHHEVCDEQMANNVFREACELEGIPKWRLFSLWAGVTVGGASSWEQDGLSNGHSIVNGVIV